MSKKYTFKSVLEPDRLKLYKKVTGKDMNMQFPQTFNEKIHWISVYAREPQSIKLRDKFKVKTFIKNKIGEKYLIECLGIYNNFDEINFEKLPNQFVMKATVACGENIIVRNKKELNLKEVERKFNSWIKDNTVAKSKILIEKYLENDNQDLYDYKFFCFNGKVEYIMFIANRNRETNRIFFDTKWQRQDFTYNSDVKNINIEKPDNLDEMIAIAEILSEDFIHVRVDLYRLNNGDIKFGELTFHTMGGTALWNPPIMDFKLGQFFNIEPLKEKLVHQFETRKVIFFSQVYNMEQTIKQAYNSLQNQTRENWIWHVVDNASSDNTYKILKELEKTDNRIIIHKNKINNIIDDGNSLLEIALNYDKNDYFAILEGDGEYAPTFIEESKTAAISDNVDIVITGFSFTNLNENVSGSDIILLGHMHKFYFFIQYYNFLKVKGGKLFSNKVLTQNSIKNNFSQVDQLKNIDFCVELLKRSKNSVRIQSILYKQSLPKLKWRTNIVDEVISFYEILIKHLINNNKNVSLQIVNFIQTLTINYIYDILTSLIAADIDLSQKHKELLKIGHSKIMKDILMDKQDVFQLKKEILFKEVITWMLSQTDIEDDIVLEFAQIGQIFCASIQWEESWIKFKILHANASIKLGNNMIIKGENESGDLNQIIH
ncbi:MAG: hypothetical protein ATN32_00910 [Candidatus Epulonipiscium fishelsonii]|nr:MAG: hypothetical protein ATN32_00910 [Epulopiscium sp. AS2M-Bin002]